MKRWGPAQLTLTLAMAIGIWLIVAALCMSVGSTGEIGWPGGRALEFRRQSVLIASLIGAALAAAGSTYQAVLRNPLADPYLLGVSSGASLFAYLWQLPFVTAMTEFVGLAGRGPSEQLFAFAGAILAMLFVFGLATRRGRLEPVTLLLVGVIVNAVNGSIFLLLNTLIKDQATPAGPLAFLVGSLPLALTSHQAISATVMIAIGFGVLLWLSGELNVAALSESEASALGVRIHRLRWIALLAASLVTAVAVAISGPIGFVGLVCPHLARLIVGSDQRRLLPLSTAIGAGVLCMADAAARWLARDTLARELLPVGVLTGLLGGPFFLVLLWRRRGHAE